MNTVPGEQRSPVDPSGLRIGTPWVTTRGMKEPEMRMIVDWMVRAMDEAGKWENLDFEEFNNKLKKSKVVAGIEEEVKTICGKFLLEI